ncbi:hypothetical protein IHE55_22610 [Streptomyces pactum]|uniref:Uncharacterized protein n=1 Tax=Streptomyces pactum TaxID=68249 RepID=A0ABS0NQC2_9ACTN|nr:hypothetical protein [Streptomyces pactum]MBH5337402.1 hypothetical protein [Streptomyces pactum]
MSARQGDASVERGRRASLASAVALGARSGGRGAPTRLTTVVARVAAAQPPRIPVRGPAAPRERLTGPGPETLADEPVAGAPRGTSTLVAGVRAAVPTAAPAIPAEPADGTAGPVRTEPPSAAGLHPLFPATPFPGVVVPRVREPGAPHAGARPAPGARQPHRAGRAPATHHAAGV